MISGGGLGRVAAGESFIPFDDGPLGTGYNEIDFTLDDADPIAIEVRGGDFIASDFLIDVQVAGLRRKLRAATGRDRLTVVRGTAYQLSVTS